MQPFEAELNQLVESVWGSMFGMLVQTAQAPAALDGPRPDFVSGSVEIHGLWNGAVVVACSGDLARNIAANLFGVAAESTTLDQVQDVIGELANITGGNFKSLLPERCSLALPVVLPGPGAQPVAGSVLTRVGYLCDEHPMVVSVWQA